MDIKTLRDIGYPFRLDQYRPDRFGHPGRKRLLVVVHGYWDKRYPLQWFMHMLADQLRDHVVYQYSFESPGGLKRNPVSLELVARNLGHELMRVKCELARGRGAADDQLEGIAFVGHSTGGLVARRCFVDNYRSLGPGQFVFLATPHQGSEVAKAKNSLSESWLTSWFAGTDRQTHDLAPGSDFLWRLTRDWNNLPGSAVDRMLSVVGTLSNTKGSWLWKQPKGRWGRSDGVVRTTSALLEALKSRQSLGIQVPVGHNDLRDVAQQWRDQESIKRGWPSSTPVPVRDMAFAAAIQFLRGNAPQGHTEMWTRIIDYFEELEKNWHQGRRREGTAAARVLDESIMPIGRGHEGPVYLHQLQEYCRQAKTFWEANKTGAAVIRLDFIDVPPRPRIISLNGPAGPLAVKRSRYGPTVRHGARWATLHLPELEAGPYQVAWKHGSQTFDVDFQVVAHFTTVVETNGYTGENRILNSDKTNTAADVANGLDSLEEQLGKRDWNKVWEED